MPDLEDIFKSVFRSRSRYDRRYQSRRYEDDSGPDVRSLVRRFKNVIIVAAVAFSLLLGLLVVGVILIAMNVSTVRGWASSAWDWTRGVASQASAVVMQPEQGADEQAGGLAGAARELGVPVPAMPALNTETLATIGTLKILSDQVLGGLSLPAADLVVARAEIARVVQGLSDGRIAGNVVTQLTEALYTTDAQGNRTLRAIDATGLQQIVEQTRRLADAAGIEPATTPAPAE